MADEEAAAPAAPAVAEATPEPRDDVATVRRLVAPLSKEQLIELLANAAVADAALLAACERIVKESPASRRLMIRNVAFSTKDDDFIALFSSFGPLDDAAIVRDRDDKSKGYGFVTFHTSEGVAACFKAEELLLDGRRLLAKLAGDPYADFSLGSASGKPGDRPAYEGSRRKLFVRNLGAKTANAALAQIFGAYGELEECVVVCDPEGRSKGYGFVTFVEARDAIKAVQQPQRVIDGKVAFVAFATPTRNRNNTQGQGQGADRPQNRRSSSANYPDGMMATGAMPMGTMSPGGGMYYTSAGHYHQPMMPYYGRPSVPSPPNDPTYNNLMRPLASTGYDYLAAAAVAAAAAQQQLR